MKRFAMIFIVAIGLAAATLFAAASASSVAAPEVVNRQLETGDFMFEKGRLWTVVEINGISRAALVDSGSSISVVPRKFAPKDRIVDYQRAITPVGNRRLPILSVSHLRIAGEDIRDMPVGTGNGKFVIVGNDYLFGNGSVLFTKEGIVRSVAYDADEALHCAGLTLDFQGPSPDYPVKSIAFNLPIDGEEQLVYFDTGRREILTATAALPAPTPRLRKKITFTADGFGSWKMRSYHERSAALRVGDRPLLLDYRHYFRDRSLRQPFILGAGILERFDIVVEHRSGRACFYERGHFESGG